MKTLVQTDFGRDHLLVGCVHTLALPGTPLYDRSGGMRKIVRQAREEAEDPRGGRLPRAALHQ